MMKKTLAICMILLTTGSWAQVKLDHKTEEQLEDADIFLEITDFQSALNLYNQLYKDHPEIEQIELKIGMCHYYLRHDDQENLEWFLKARERNEVEASYYLGMIYHRKEEFNRAISSFQRYKSGEGEKFMPNDEIDRLIAMSERAKVFLSSPAPVNVYNIGGNINSEYDEYGPMITGDESMMAFTSRKKGSTGNKVDPYGKYFEDVYFSQRKDEEWQSPVQAPAPINTETHDAAIAMSPDGQTMIIYRTNEDLTAGDLYYSRLEGVKWSEPVKYGDYLNSEWQEASATIAEDGNTIYFSSNRPGGFGGKDIYRIVRFGNDQWSLPLNLGATVNTPYDEDAPFIHPNGSTLYFSSKGHSNIGGYDIFKTSLEENYWTHPENMKYPVNSVNDDLFFVLSSDGNRGYYSSATKGGFGGHDIYVVSFAQDVERLKIIKGKVSSVSSGQGIRASIKLTNSSGKSFGEFNSNETGKFLIVLPPDQDFNVTVEAEGHGAVEDQFHFKGGTPVSEMTKNYELVLSNE